MDWQKRQSYFEWTVKGGVLGSGIDEDKRTRLTKSKEDDKQPDIKPKKGKEDVKQKKLSVI